MANKGRPSNYRVNLDQLMQLYAANYTLMTRLFPASLEVGESLRLIPKVGEDYLLESKELTRYTALYEIRQATSQVYNYLQPQLLVRLYHDARLAEVCASQQIFKLKPRYDYPNKKMHHQDEKHQTNQFLNDWLVFCIKQRIKVEFA
ncbi:hypothetical protein AHAT_30330 [Agarivorans sp. Toyoura001]|uniref:DUF1249 domain-containing protein n=1 Tax=Agarivorans sp. Toyoura001 TaxID=2283141 RepID=UPI0010DD5CA4|nr:DUF1249 domain-containing protein [Agarivorans sp. Toyoura001]GDY27143.1 hypothetical protein AHAT_30330 [Agarivorans sp. Toyoura001]